MSEPRNTSRLLFAAIPVMAFLALAAVFYRGLSGDPSEVPSVLINKPVPEFSLPAIEGLTRNGEPVPGLSSADLARGNVTLVNVWASWCPPCRVEHPLLMELAKRGDVRIVGINNKDNPENARRFLGSLGTPYSAVGADASGRTAIDWGVYGVPETFLVDGQGVIRLKWIGPLTEEAISTVIVPKIAEIGKVRSGGGS